MKTCEEDDKRTKYMRAKFERITLPGQNADYDAKSGWVASKMKSMQWHQEICDTYVSII